MCFDRKDDPEVSDECNNDLIWPEAEGKELDNELLSWAETNSIIHAEGTLSIFIKKEIPASKDLSDDKDETIESVEEHELVHQGPETTLFNL